MRNNLYMKLRPLTVTARLGVSTKPWASIQSFVDLSKSFTLTEKPSNKGSGLQAFPGVGAEHCMRVKLSN